MENEKQPQNAELDVLDILLDEDNEQPIDLYDQDGKAYKFDQVAIIPLNEKLYAILKPISKLPGIADDEAIVFAVEEDENGNGGLKVETDEPTAMKVFDEYYKLLDEQGK